MSYSFNVAQFLVELARNSHYQNQIAHIAHLPEQAARFGELSQPLPKALQEALTNLHRHSGSAIATIVLSRSATMVRLEIADEGKGIAYGPGFNPGVGICGMKERLHQLQGLLEVKPGIRGGTCVSAALPLASATGALRSGQPEPVSNPGGAPESRRDPAAPRTV